MRVQLDRRDLAKYPFLKEAQEWVAGRTGTLEQFLSTTYGKVAARSGAHRVIGAITGEDPAAGTSPQEPEKEVFSYALARILVSCAKDRALIDRLTRFEAGRAWGFLQVEEPAKRSYVAASIGIDPDARELSVVEYVELVPHLREDRWRLVNRQVAAGRVRLGEDDLEELIRERIRHLLQRQLPLPVPARACETLAPLLADITASFQATILRDFGEVEEGAFPPCLQALIGAITAGTNLPHAGRFAIVAFLHNIGMNPVQIVEIFARAPDFDAERTRYQVEHISGRGGTEYTAPSCATLRTTGFCVNRDSTCERVNHPLSYYRIKKKREKAKGKEKEGGKEEKAKGTEKEAGKEGKKEAAKEKEPVRQSSP
ncbi:MAG TPA: DNA primase regulatory subunit PriL [Methanomicrobiales archaeon]|nr:DNA primase regulatory subunit PriL [Methanomicrobiales archaeon]